MLNQRWLKMNSPSRLYWICVAVVLSLLSYTTGVLTGYLYGWNDSYKREVIAYRAHHKRGR